MTLPQDVAAALDRLAVGAAAVERLEVYVDVLERWRQRINLVGPTTRDGIWRRHVLDSAQLWPHLPDRQAPLLDLGSGAGLPGLILALLGHQDVTLLDSDRRKTVFLAEAARAAGVQPKIIADRFDGFLRTSSKRYAVVTARAVAPVARLAPTLADALAPEGYALLLKGAKAQDELTEAAESWNVHWESIPSITERESVVLKLWGIQRHGNSDWDEAAAAHNRGGQSEGRRR